MSKYNCVVRIKFDKGDPEFRDGIIHADSFVDCAQYMARTIAVYETLLSITLVEENKEEV